MNNQTKKVEIIEEALLESVAGGAKDVDLCEIVIDLCEISCIQCIFQPDSK